ncbi:MAG TPA: cobalamin biosynthesis protein CobW [Rhizobiales bacterium]|nr:cobalamin biosynthesis protein CobW [Hyphomicrobiales bacterium]
MRNARKIPATVITGFLGAGKTTLIRHLIENANGRRIALIVNEFGDVGIDGEVLRACGNEDCGDEDIIELANGCICCTVAEDFIPTMEKLLARKEPPEHIVIETSGLALPQPLVRAFNWPEIKTRVTVDGVVTLIDAAALALGRGTQDEARIQAARQADDMLDHKTPLGELFEDQINCADLVIMNKTDLISDEEAARIENDIRGEIRNGAAIIRAAHGQLPPELLVGLEAGAENDERLSHHESAGGDHHHDHDDFESFAVDCGEIGDQRQFIETLAPVLANHGILRLKGFAAVKGKPMRLVVQAVGPRIDAYFDREWVNGEPRRSALVVIGETPLDKPAIRTAILAAVHDTGA